MKLRNVDSEVVPERKITHYLLNPAHTVGGSKAAFFLAAGFSAVEWQRLRNALILHAAQNDIVESEETCYGTRHVVDGPLRAPGGGTLNVRSVWYTDEESAAPRFVTAHPLPRL
jgi:hypothetical protein